MYVVLSAHCWWIEINSCCIYSSIHIRYHCDAECNGGIFIGTCCIIIGNRRIVYWNNSYSNSKTCWCRSVIIIYCIACCGCYHYSLMLVECNVTAIINRPCSCCIGVCCLTSACWWIGSANCSCIYCSIYISIITCYTECNCIVFIGTRCIIIGNRCIIYRIYCNGYGTWCRSNALLLSLTV